MNECEGSRFEFLNFLNKQQMHLIRFVPNKILKNQKFVEEN